MSGRYRAVFFDLGGTLFSYRAIGGWTVDVLVAAGKRLEVEAPVREVGMAFRAASQRANQSFVDRPFYLHRDLFRQTFRLFAEALEREASDEFLDWFETEFREALVGNMVLRDDCLDTLRSLRAKGLYLSIVSNIDDDHLIPMVEDSGLAEVLHHWTSSEEARSCKPDSRFFQLALKKAGCRAEDVLFVGDSPWHDVQGANAAGMATALIVEERSRAPLQGGTVTVAADHEIAALSELIKITD